MLAEEKRQMLPWQIIQKFFALPFPANYPETQLHQGGKGFWQKIYLRALMSNLAQVTYLNLKMFFVAVSFSFHLTSLVRLRCASPVTHTKYTWLLTLSLANVGIYFLNPVSEPVKWCDYLPGCLVLPSHTKPGRCIAYDHFKWLHFKCG